MGGTPRSRPGPRARGPQSRVAMTRRTKGVAAAAAGQQQQRRPRPAPPSTSLRCFVCGAAEAKIGLAAAAVAGYPDYRQEIRCRRPHRHPQQQRQRPHHCDLETSRHLHPRVPRHPVPPLGRSGSIAPSTQPLCQRAAIDSGLSLGQERQHAAREQREEGKGGELPPKRIQHVDDWLPASHLH